MTRTAERFETVAMAVADMNSTVQPFDFWNDAEHNEELMRYEVAIADDYDMDEHAQWERETREWLSNHSNCPTDPNYSEIYSDVFKDLYGFRPRW